MKTIQKSTLAFLSDLKVNNNRDWFRNNHLRYSEARNNFEIFVQDILDSIVEFDPILKGLEVKNCTYRMNRDIRFSNDKTVYKSHFGAFIVRGGKKNGDKYTGYYVHVEPGNSMIAGGAYMPPAQWLSAIRRRIDEQGEKLVSIINNKDFANFFGNLEGEKLKTAPKGYPRDHRFIEFLKLKSYLVSRQISDSEITSENCSGLIIKGCRIMKPLNDFLNNN